MLSRTYNTQGSVFRYATSILIRLNEHLSFFWSFFSNLHYSLVHTKPIRPLGLLNYENIVYSAKYGLTDYQLEVQSTSWSQFDSCYLHSYANDFEQLIEAEAFGKPLVFAQKSQFQPIV